MAVIVFAANILTPPARVRARGSSAAYYGRAVGSQEDRLSAPRHAPVIGICIKEQLSPAVYQEEDGHWISTWHYWFIGC